MTAPVSAGISLAVVAGLMAGNCMLPSKFLRFWPWENMWAVFSVVSLVVLPWGLALLFIGNLHTLYGSLPASSFLAPAGFGFGWGIAQILFGISVARLGMSLAYAIIVGMGAALGTLVPMLASTRVALPRQTLILVFAGILLMGLGIVLTAWSGRLREKGRGDSASGLNQSGYRVALLIAIICGLMAPMLNYSFAFGQTIAMQAVALGHPSTLAAYAVWPIALAGGFVPNAAYSLFLLNRNRSWTAFIQPLPDVWLSSLMAALWMGAMAVYGMSAVWLGTLGTSVGWGLFQIFMIMTASLSGLMTGEWSRASAQSRLVVTAGLLSLLVATVLLAVATRH